MKTILSAIAAIITITSTASAWDRGYISSDECRPSRYSEPSRYCETPRYCEPVRHCEVYKVSTCEINRCCHQKVGYDHCGRSYYYTVTVVTYRNYYSDGSSNTFTRTFSS
jgi:hypothetical protein